MDKKMHQLLPPNPKEVPIKKLRGLKGYFRSLKAEAKSLESTLDFGEDSWFDHWHHHVDWDGYGNASWRMRAEHLKILAIAFDRLAFNLANFTKPFQIWILLDQQEADCDGVFVHSPNPNEDNFPFVLEDALWGNSVIAQHFESLLPTYRFRAGELESDGSRYFFVYALGVGLPIDTALQGE